MPVPEERLLELLYIRGEVSAPGVAAEIGGQITSVDVSAQLMAMLLQGLAEEVKGQPPRWRLTDAGIRVAWECKAQAAG